MLTLFSPWMPVQTVLACLELLEHNHLRGLVAMAALDLAEERLLRCRSFDKLVLELQNLKEDAPKPEQLLTGARGLLRASSIVLPWDTCKLHLDLGKEGQDLAEASAELTDA